METLLQNLLNGLATGAMYSLIALGYTMVYGILKLINFAHGDVFMVGAFVGYYGVDAVRKTYGVEAIEPGIGLFALILMGAMLICGILGYLNERIAYRPLRNSPRIASLITAIGVAFFLEFGGQLVFGPDPKFYPTLIDRKLFELGGVSFSSYQLIIIGLAVVTMAVLQYIIYRTTFGRAMRAVSYNFESASLMGIPTDRVIAMTFVLGSVLAGVGSTLWGLYYSKLDPLMGIMPGLKAFVAAVLGGIGNVPGAMVGGLIIGVVEAFVGGSRFSMYKDGLAFLILIGILLFRPAGLFGRFETEKV
jgi:branched-chain amino acid transport system permease protein